MRGWTLPPARESVKTKNEFERERAARVDELARSGYLTSERIRQALLTVCREDFIPSSYRDYAYSEVPLPLPGEHSTISCPHSYPLFYEPLGLDVGHRFLEVGLGSGYGSALAREVVGDRGLVVAMEIDAVTYEFGRANLRRAGYDDLVLVRADGALGHPTLSPFDRISITAACQIVPAPLIDQLSPGGRLIAPVVAGQSQHLVLLEKTATGVRTERVCDVLYLPLRGRYGA